jgi:hypothetical protein
MDARALADMFSFEQGYTPNIYKRVALAATQQLPRDYQIEMIWPIFMSVIHRRGQRFFIKQPRQSGKSTEIAEMVSQLCGIAPLYLADQFPYLRKGINVANFAPEKDKAEILTDKMEERLTSWLYNDVLGVVANTNNSRHFKLNTGSEIITGTASDTAKCPEGNSLDLCNIDEAHAVSNMRIKKSIRPQLAARNGTMVYIFTASEDIREHGYVYMACKREDERREKGLTPSPFFREKTLEEIFASHGIQEYRRYVLSEIEDLGIDDESIQSQYFGDWDPEIPEEFMNMKILKRCRKGPLISESDDPCIVGIDVARGGGDSTIVEVIRIKDRHVLNWLEIPGDDFIQQDIAIKLFLLNYNVLVGRADNTGLGAGLIDNLEANTILPDGRVLTGLNYLVRHNITGDERELSFMSMKRKTRDRWYSYPDLGDKDFGKKLQQKFEVQICGLIRKKVGQKVRIDHPNKRGYRSDYADSHRLALDQLEEIVDEEMEKEESFGEVKGKVPVQAKSYDTPVEVTVVGKSDIKRKEMKEAADDDYGEIDQSRSRHRSRRRR